METNKGLCGTSSTSQPPCYQLQLSTLFSSLFIVTTKSRIATTSIHEVGTGQTRLRNSQGATQRSWLARCSPPAPEFSREQSTWKARKIETLFSVKSKTFLLMVYMTVAKIIPVKLNEMLKQDG